ncbi:hypothetical protein SAY87_019436 [Trapa incisa]|uniref:Nuclear pore complex protein NUP214 n=1 Tax=Trapa incisa TaxID=236973 RepID=A0AAN7Q7B0_9MYRT|nr:hypothetical protein SAY87_019436 [Trapa incisa]
MSSCIELKDEKEGDCVVTSDFFFDRIGEPVPVKFTDGYSETYELDSLPSQPLAVSERFQLLFVAHSDRFCVARTADVMEAAREIKDKGNGLSVMELSIVDVPIGKVRILSLSPDSSTLAASVGRDVHFFSVDSLLNKDPEPFSSCSVEESGFLKEMRWLEKVEKSFILLSNIRKLYHGNVGSPLKQVMDEVDAADVKGNFIAVARRNTLSILSSNLKEKLCLSLSFGSWTRDCGEDGHVKVDSVKWIRPDCIVLGCFELNSDGMEENYFVEVIRSKDGRIDCSKDPSQVVTQSFYYVFPGMVDDILPTGDGPYTLFGYLDQCKLAIAANRKNTDGHIVLFSWLLGEEQNEVVVVDVNRDKWLPRIALQDNGDENLVVGLCIDKVSVHGKVNIQLGVEEERGLSPYCVLICLTLEGKLIMFHVASLSESTDSFISDAQVSDEEADVVSSQAVAQKAAGELYASASFAEKSLFSGANQLKQNVVDAGGEAHKGMATSGFQVSPQTWASGEIIPPNNFGAKFMSDSKNFEGDRPGGTGVSASTESIMGTRIGKPLHGKELMAPSPLVSSSSFPQQIGQKDSIAVGRIESIPSICSSQMSFQEATSGFSATKEDKKSGLHLGVTPKEPSISKQFGNIKEMVNELDTLLYSIEGKGGIKDACIVAQKTPVQALEKGVGTLSDQCTIWKGTMEDRLEEVHQLLDKTVQVLSRTTYFKGVIKQATDDRYWELWNRQKLNPELELKRQHILKLNQDLTNQLILLERHFNSIELEKFSDGARGPRGRQAHQKRLGSSRSLHSLHSLHNTLTSQLAAAEQLSDCLSKQMEVLSINSPQVKTKSVKKELFDMIGLPFDDSFSTPMGSKVSDTPSAKKLMIPSSSASSKDQSKRNQFGALKTSEPETARRRRDSLGQGWTSFEPPKTTVKRMLLPENHKVTSGKFSLSMDKQRHSSDERVTAARKNRTSPSTLSYQSENDGMHESSEQKSIGSPLMAFNAINESPGSGLTQIYQRTNVSTPLTSRSSITDSKNTSTGGTHPAATKSISQTTERPFTDSVKETKPWFPPPSDSSQTEKKPTLLSSSTGKGTMFNRSPFELVKQGTNSTESSPSVIVKGEGISSSSFGRTTHQAFPSVSAKVPQLGYGMGKSSPGDTISPSTGLNVESSKSLPMFSSFSPQQSSSPSISSFKTVTSSEPSKDGPWNISKAVADNQSPFAKFSSSSVTPSASSSSSLIFSTSSISSAYPSASSFSSPFSFPALKPFSASSLTPSVNSTLNTLGSDVEANLLKVTPGLDRTTTEHVPLPKQVLPSEPTSRLGDIPTSTSETSSGLPPTPELEGDRVKVRAESERNSSPETVPSQVLPTEPIPKLGVSQAPTLTKEISSELRPTSESRQPKVDPDLVKVSSPEPDLTSSGVMSMPKHVLPSEPTPKLGFSQASTSISEIKSGMLSVNETSADKTSTSTSAVTFATRQEGSSPPFLFPTPPTIGNVALQKIENPEVINQEDGMEEEEPETNNIVPSFNLGSLDSFGLGSSTSTAPKGNPFGSSFGNMGTVSSAPSPFGFTVPSGEMFRPASFSFPSQSSQPSQLQSSTPFSGGFGAVGITPQAPPTQGGFGQPAQIGGGQQALGSVLGSFGQSRQIGSAIPGAGLASSGGFGGGFGGAASTGGGFSSAATSGGFASIASAGGGFGALTSGGGGFGSAASAGGGFGSFAAAAPAGGGFGGVASAGAGFGGFAAAAPAGGGFGGATSGGGFPTAGGGFRAIGNQQPAGGFSSFGGSGGNTTSKLPDIFTQMRK